MVKNQGFDLVPHRDMKGDCLFQGVERFHGVSGLIDDAAAGAKVLLGHHRHLHPSSPSS